MERAKKQTFEIAVLIAFFLLLIVNYKTFMYFEASYLNVIQ